MKLNEMTELYISYRRALGEKFKTNAQALRSFMKHIGGDTNPVELTVGQVEPYLYYPTAIGYESGDTAEEQARQREAWTTVQRGHAVANGLPVIAVNRTGHEEDPSGQTRGIEFWGSSFIAGPQGEFLFRAEEHEEQVAVVEVNLSRSEHVRRWWPFLRDRRIEHFHDLTRRFRD